MGVRTVGLIGGMSWHASALYYRLLNEAVAVALGPGHSAHSVMVTIDYDDVLRAGIAGDWVRVAETLVEAACGIERAGGECIVVTSNTAHVVADRIACATSLPLLHVVDAVCGALRRRNMRRVGLMATEQTVKLGLYQRDDDIAIDVPPPDEQSDLQSIIHDELSHGIVRDASRQRCEEIASRLARAGAGGIVLGCTELSLIYDGFISAVPIFDSTRLHVESAIAFSLSKSDNEMKGAARK